MFSFWFLLIFSSCSGRVRCDCVPDDPAQVMHDSSMHGSDSAPDSASCLELVVQELVEKGEGRERAGGGDHVPRAVHGHETHAVEHGGVPRDLGAGLAAR